MSSLYCWASRFMRIPLLVGPIRDLATWAHVRWPWSALGRLRTSFVGPLDIPVVCGTPLFGDWGFPVETRLDSKTVMSFWAQERIKQRIL